VVLLHGLPEFWYGWRLQIAPLAAAGFRVVAPDLRGYNVSSKPDGLAAYTAGKLAAARCFNLALRLASRPPDPPVPHSSRARGRRFETRRAHVLSDAVAPRLGEELCGLVDAPNSLGQPGSCGNRSPRRGAGGSRDRALRRRMGGR
jgi:Alpha/beta hydrolase family